LNHWENDSPTGTHTPLPCQFLSSCPKGTIIEQHFGLLAIVVAVDVLLALILIYNRLFEIRRAGQPWFSILPLTLQGWLKLNQKKEKRDGKKKNVVKVEEGSDRNKGESLEGLKSTSIDITDADGVVQSNNGASAPSAAASSSSESESDSESFDENDASTLISGFQKSFDGHANDLKMNFQFTDLSLKLATGKSILQGVTGEIFAGRMTAIMGPSGAGSK
jgi:ABC-type multidrug transport system fused ATPase/permease subunit